MTLHASSHQSENQNLKPLFALGLAALLPKVLTNIADNLRLFRPMTTLTAAEQSALKLLDIVDAVDPVKFQVPMLAKNQQEAASETILAFWQHGITYGLPDAEPCHLSQSHCPGDVSQQEH